MLTLIHLRHDLPHAVLGLPFGMDRSTVTRAVGRIRTLLAERGRAVPDRPGIPLRTVEDVFAYTQTEGIELRLDATELQARRTRAARGGRRAFVAGKKKQNTMKTTVVTDHQGRTLWTDAMRPRRIHDVTAVRTEGIDACFRHFPDVEVLLDEGCLGLRRDHPDQALTPPRKPNKSALPEFHERWRHHRRERLGRPQKRMGPSRSGSHPGNAGSG